MDEIVSIFVDSGTDYLNKWSVFEIHSYDHKSVTNTVTEICIVQNITSTKAKVCKSIFFGYLLLFEQISLKMELMLGRMFPDSDGLNLALQMSIIVHFHFCEKTH